MCTNIMASAHVILKKIRQRLRVAVSQDGYGSKRVHSFAGTYWVTVGVIKELRCTEILPLKWELVPDPNLSVG